MAIKGLSRKKSYPYITVDERSDLEQPTIFWLYPKDMQGTYRSLETYQKSGNVNSQGARTINAEKMFQADIKEFIKFCSKVENYQFSEDFELSEKGVSTFEIEGELRLLAMDLPPQTLLEIQNVVSDWVKFQEGIDAYEAYLAFKKERRNDKVVEPLKTI
jgi:hypothetical protein